MGMVRTRGWRRIAAPIATAALACACGVMLAAVPLDEFGGRRDTRRAATGFFRTTRAEGRWWLVDPDGHLFLTVGVNSVTRQIAEEATDEKESPRGSEREWARESAARLRKWGFNTIGQGSDRGMRGQGLAYAVNLKCMAALRREEESGFPDVFDDAFERGMRRQLAPRCRELRDERWLLGYFTDEELPWGSGARPGETLLAQFLGLADEAPGREALLAFLAARHTSIEELNDAWRTAYESFDEVGRVPQAGSHIPEADIEAFQREVAQEYFRVVHDALRAGDRNHLILGPCFPGSVPRPVLEAMGDYVDVVSLVILEGALPLDDLQMIHRVTGRPVIIAEFGTGGTLRSGEDGPVLDSRILEERARYYEEFVPRALALPMVVGVHWFSYLDQREADRQDGEPAQIGLVSRRNEPHYTLAEAVSRVNAGVYEQAGSKRGSGNGTAAPQ